MRLSKFLREESGALAPLFTISLVPILALIGASLDLSGMWRTKNTLQVAVDSTALAVNHQLHLATQQKIQTKAAAFFAGQTGDLEQPSLDPVAFDVDAGSVTVSASAVYTPSIMRAFGLGPFELTARAKTVLGDQAIEVALVLDNSGSMSGSKLTSLKKAASSLVTILFDSQSATTRIKIGVVPFSGAVNVGAGNASKTWMDKNALSPVHSESFASAANRFTLFNEMKNVSWAGCVESRPGEHAVNDTVPTTSDPISLFVPMFAPDESDEEGKRNPVFVNNYLSDDGSGSNCKSADKADKSDRARQKRICKYKNQKPSTSGWGSTNKGPNFWCNSDPILPLSEKKQELLNAIDGMKAKGYTNIHEGLMWGWRVLSPSEPFTEGEAYGTPNLRKYIVLMTDGANTINGRSTHNNSDYSAYGYASNNRLDPDSEDMAGWELKSAMDDRLEEACTNARAGEHIAIYTIAFQVNDQPTLKRLKDCATRESMAKTAGSGTDLEQVFQQIARDLGKLRLTE